MSRWLDIARAADEQTQATKKPGLTEEPAQNSRFSDMPAAGSATPMEPDTHWLNVVKAAADVSMPVQLAQIAQLAPSEEPNGTIPDPSGAGHVPARIVLLAVPEGVPEAWAQGVADLLAMSPPGSISPERWNRLREDSFRLLRDWAAQAHSCGWTALDLFGCHPRAPLARQDCAGLVMLMDTWEVVSLDDDGADLRASGPLRFRPGMIGNEAVAIWNLTPAFDCP